MDELPKNYSGKVHKSELRQKYWKNCGRNGQIVVYPMTMIALSKR